MLPSANRDYLARHLQYHIPQITGDSPPSHTRNIALISRPWFLSFLEWIGGSDDFPGKIDNSALYSSLLLGSPADFDFVELNVWAVLVGVFGGGSRILRPYMQHPLTGESRVVVNPLLFSVTLENGTTVDRHSDPDWTAVAFREQISRRLSFNASATEFISKMGDLPISDDLTMDQVLEDFGKDLIVKPGRIELRTMNVQSRRIGRMTPSVFNEPLYVVPESLNIMRYGSVLGMFTAFVHVFSHAPAVRERSDNLDGGAAGALAEYVKECDKCPTSAVAPRALFAELVEQQPDPGEWRAISLTVLARRFLRALEGSAIGTVISGKTRIERRCPCCARGIASEKNWRVLAVDFQRRLFRKSRLEDAIRVVVGRHTTPLSNPWTCQGCGHRGVAKEFAKFLQLPHVLVVALPRLVRENQTVKVITERVEYEMRLDLSDITKHPEDVFELTGIVAVAGSRANPRFKGFAYEKALASWVCFGETHVIQTTPANVIVPAAATLFVYQREGPMPVEERRSVGGLA
jgi:hypothetical protein